MHFNNLVNILTTENSLYIQLLQVRKYKMERPKREEGGRAVGEGEGKGEEEDEK